MNELERALRKVRNGDDPSMVAEEMAHRITQKILYLAIRKLIELKDYSDLVQSSKLEYQKNYIDKYSKVADHVDNKDTAW
jgi:glutamyl-tRNA reductase